MKNSVFVRFLFLFCGILVIALPAAAQQDFKPYTQEFEDSEIGIDMVPIKGGTFMMGSSQSEDETPVHKVELSSFWMGKFEVSWQQYELYVNSADAAETEGQNKTAADAVARPSKTYLDPSFGMGKEDYPAISMSQFAALSFARWLSLKTGHFYRLPTEAEWEYACRAGSSTAYYGDDPAKLGRYAWFLDNSDYRYHKVGTKKPNSWGLYNMLGNVAEWTMDQYKKDYYSKFADQTAEDPWAEPLELYPRTVRGGSWNHEKDKLRCASRIASDPQRWNRNDPQIPKSLWWNTNSPFVGFRLVRPVDPPSKKEQEKFWKETLDQFYYE